LRLLANTGQVEKIAWHSIIIDWSFKNESKEEDY